MEKQVQLLVTLTNRTKERSSRSISVLTAVFFVSSRNALPALRDDTTNGCGADEVLTGYKVIKHMRVSIEFLSNRSTWEENKRG